MLKVNDIETILFIEALVLCRSLKSSVVSFLERKSRAERFLWIALTDSGTTRKLAVFLQSIFVYLRLSADTPGMIILNTFRGPVLTRLQATSSNYGLGRFRTIWIPRGSTEIGISLPLHDDHSLRRFQWRGTREGHSSCYVSHLSLLIVFYSSSTPSSSHILLMQSTAIKVLISRWFLVKALVG